MLPIALGVALGGLLALGFGAVFLLAAALRLVALVVRLRIRDPRRSRPGGDLPRQVASPAATVARSSASDMAESFAMFGRRRDLLALLAIAAAGSLGMSMRYFVVYFTSVLGFGSLTAGSLLSVHALGFALGGSLGGLMSDRAGRHLTLAFSSVVSGVATLPLVCARSPATVAAVYFLIAVASAWPVAFQAVMGELCPDTHRGRLFSGADLTARPRWASGRCSGDGSGSRCGQPPCSSTTRRSRCCAGPCCWPGQAIGRHGGGERRWGLAESLVSPAGWGPGCRGHYPSGLERRQLEHLPGVDDRAREAVVLLDSPRQPARVSARPAQPHGDVPEGVPGLHGVDRRSRVLPAGSLRPQGPAQPPGQGQQGRQEHEGREQQPPAPHQSPPPQVHPGPSLQNGCSPSL